MEDDIKKIWWVIVGLVIVVVLGTNVVSPTVTKVKGQKTAIENVIYTAP